MLTRLGALVIRRRKVVLVGAAVLFVAAGAYGGPVSEHLSAGGFDDPGSESFRADEALLDTFGSGTPNLILLVTAPGGDVDDPAVAAAGTALTQELAAEPDVTNVGSYWTLGSAPPLRSDGRDRALVLARIEGTQDEVNDRVEELAPKYRRDGDLVVGVGGYGEVFREVGTTIEKDLVRAETIALPITLILLLLVFGSLVSSSLPLAIGALSVVGTFVVLRLLSTVTEVSIFSLNLTTAMGLGLAIDYSLFMVSRFREELRAGYEPDVAVQRTVRTAGRTVAFGAVTVAASLCALLVFPLAFLRSFAYAGVAVAFLAGAFSVVVLPAILGALGHRVDSLSVLKRTHRQRGDDGFWHRTALLVMRRPVVFATGAIAVLLFLGTPFLHLDISLPDDRVLPESAVSRQIHDVIRDEFSSQEAGTESVVALGIGDPATRAADIDAYASRLALLPGVSRVDAATGTYCAEGTAAEFGCAPGTKVLQGGSGRHLTFNTTADGGSTYLAVVPSVEPLSSEGEDLVAAIRGTEAPFDVEVTGQSAQLTDIKDSLFSRLPLALGIIAVITFVVLFLQFGSVIIPIKALILNLLSLTATFGAMVFVFQDGHLSDTLNFTATGQIDATTPILMFCVVFGLSMDYEVFLLSRIKEEHDRTGDNELSVAVGLERTGGIVTAAALLIAVIFLAFATSQITFIKLFGIGLTLAVLMDAFLIRALLVPAFMRLAGEWNWWAPAPLRRFHDRFGISEHVDLDGPATPPAVRPLRPGVGRLKAVWPPEDATGDAAGNGTADKEPAGVSG